MTCAASVRRTPSSPAASPRTTARRTPCSPRSPGGGARTAGTPPIAAPRSRTGSRRRPTDCPSGPTSAFDDPVRHRGRRDRPLGGSSASDGLDDYDDRPQPAAVDGTSGCRRTSSTGSSIRASCWPTPTLDRTGRRPRSNPSWPGASSTPTCCSSGPTRRGRTSARVRPDRRTTRPGGASSIGLARRDDRLPDRRRRDAPAAGDRLDAQPGPDDRRPASSSRTCTCVAVGAPGTSCEHLVDGDLASNNHGWQWVGRHRHRRLAVLPGLQPDRPAAAMGPRRRVRRRWIPELGTRDYPAPIVDHKAERQEALDRYQAIKRA